MQNFTEHGQNVIQDLSNRYSISTDAVTCMLHAVNNGHGSMAQFNCPELGGGGQWMQGGMTMVGDMFNNGLKSTVDNLCSELSNALYNGNPPIYAPVKRQQNFNGSQQQQQGNMGMNSITIQGGGQGNWWGDHSDLGIASSTGGQNNIQYAVFPQSRRLAININGQVTIYDTMDHQIGGVSQQQGGDASMTFGSQYGMIQVSQLPVVSIDGVLQQTPQQTQPAFEEMPMQVQDPIQPAYTPDSQHNASANEEDIFNKIERLAQLNEKGALTNEEFATKKSELLQRL